MSAKKRGKKTVKRTQRTPEKTTEKVAGNLPENMPEKAADKVIERTQENTPGKTAAAPESTAEKASERRSFSIIANRRIFYIISMVIIVIGVCSMIIQGFNLDIDFVGGTTMHYNLKKSIDTDEIAKIDSIVSEVTGEPASQIQKTGDSGTEVIIKTKELDSATRDKLSTKLKDTYKITDSERYAVDNVSPTVGKDLRRAAVLATVVAVILMLIYITVRFEFRSGIAAILALLHDVFILITVYSLFEVPVNINFIAATLTILGYSINATIIVFDRIREERRLNSRESFELLADKGIKKTLGRSINTTITTLLTIGMIFILGVPSIRNFAFPLIIGIISGLYSSVFLAGSLWHDIRKINFKKA